VVGEEEVAEAIGGEDHEGDAGDFAEAGACLLGGGEVEDEGLAWAGSSAVDAGGEAGGGAWFQVPAFDDGDGGLLGEAEAQGGECDFSGLGVGRGVGERGAEEGSHGFGEGFEAGGTGGRGRDGSLPALWGEAGDAEGGGEAAGSAEGAVGGGDVGEWEAPESGGGGRYANDDRVAVDAGVGEASGQEEGGESGGDVVGNRAADTEFGLLEDPCARRKVSPGGREVRRRFDPDGELANSLPSPWNVEADPMPLVSSAM
jgi:hypothetical protein